MAASAVGRPPSPPHVHFPQSFMYSVFTASCREASASGCNDDADQPRMQPFMCGIRMRSVVRLDGCQPRRKGGG